MQWRGGLMDSRRLELPGAPSSTNVVSAEWVFTRKADRKVFKTKARLVARGFSQRPRVYTNENYPPLPAASFVHLMAAILCELQLDLFAIWMYSRRSFRPH